jgi:hypothetical protein
MDDPQATRQYRPTLVRLTPDIDGPLRAYADSQGDRKLADVIRQAAREFLERNGLLPSEPAAGKQQEVA